MIYLVIFYGLFFPLGLKILFGPLLSNFFFLVIYLMTVIFNSLAIIKIVKDYINYGDKIFKITNKNKVSDNDLIVYELSKLKTYQRHFIVNNTLIVINEAGIFEFAKIGKYGLLKGDIKDEYLSLDNKKIVNPFIIYKSANYYFITNSNIVYQVKGVRLITRRLLYNMMEKALSKKIYKKEEIDKIYNKMSTIVKNK